MFPVKPDFNNHINAIFEKNDRFTFGTLDGKIGESDDSLNSGDKKAINIP